MSAKKSHSESDIKNGNEHSCNTSRKTDKSRCLAKVIPELRIYPDQDSSENKMTVDDCVDQEPRLRVQAWSENTVLIRTNIKITSKTYPTQCAKKLSI